MMMKTKIRQTTKLFFLPIALAVLSGCSGSESEEAAKASDNNKAGVEAKSESPPAKATVAVRFEVYEKDPNLEYRIDDVLYAAANLSAPKEFDLGKHTLSVQRNSSVLFEIPFVVEASDEVMVVEVVSPTRAAAMAIIDAGGSVIIWHKPSVQDVSKLPREQFSFDGAGFYGKQFDDTVLESLNQIKLRRLDVSYSNMSDNGLKLIRDLSALEQLGLNKTNVTAVGLKLVADSSPPLQHVLVEGLDLPDEFLAHLRECQLSILTVRNTNFSDEYLDALKGRDFWFCHLDGTKVTDSGMKILNGSKFGKLGLSNTSISDIGIKHCLEFEKLKEINLENTQVTEAGIEMLREKFPDIKITH